MREHIFDIHVISISHQILVEILDPNVRTCNNDNDCGGAKEGGRCLFREDGFGYCICLRTRTGDRYVKGRNN